MNSSKKIIPVDENLVITFAGLNADARILLGQIQVYCQSYRLNYDEPPSVQQVANHIASI